MYKIRNFLVYISHVLTKIYISFALIKKEVYVVNGLRRSGNHAFINWFSSALENHKIGFHDDGYVSISPTNRTLLINNANNRGAFSFIRDVRSSKRAGYYAEFVLISLEDYIPRKMDPYIPWGAVKKIAVTRSTLNIISSRLQRSMNQAKLGLDSGDMRVDLNFLKTIDWLRSSEKRGWYIWDFDAWACDKEDYRLRFLSKFNLEYNVHPIVSNHGGGSSFFGECGNSSINDVSNRWKSIDLPERILEMLVDNVQLSNLNPDEKAYLRSLVDDRNRIRGSSVVDPEESTSP
jgi:hypothetical protein